REPNNPATKLWAARRMEQLSAGNSRRAEVIALSKRFGMPGKYTSWLAVPKAEMQRYNQEKIAGQIEVIARRLAVEISNRRQKGKIAHRLRVQLNRLSRQIGRDPTEALHE